MGLNKEDLQLLVELDADPNRSMTVEEEERLRKEGCLDEYGDLTMDGVEKIDKIKEALASLAAGVPFSTRRASDPKKVREIVWQTGSISKKPVMTDRNVIIVGAPSRHLTAEKGDSATRQNLPSVFAQKTKGRFEEVFPVWFQTDGTIEPETELIWLSTNSRSQRAAVQARYFDYVTDRYRGTKWWLSESGTVLKVTVPAGGLTPEHIIAIVMAFQTDGKQWRAPGGVNHE